MVATANSDTSYRFVDQWDFSIMSLTSGTNKWASRAVIALQLAAWSAVGIVLIEKGVASLQIKSGASNNSSYADDAKYHSHHEETRPQEDAPAGGSSIGPSDSMIGSTFQLPADALSVIPLVQGVRDRQVGQKVVADEEKKKNDLESETRNSKVRRIIGPIIETNEKENDTIGPKESIESEVSSRSPVTMGRKRFRLGQVNHSGNSNGGGGAAAAIAMVAVGTIMLVLGPAVIVLRSLDERRQERRFLKLSGDEDLPPSYEQATASIEQAPTYSSLNLSIVVSCPSGAVTAAATTTTTTTTTTAANNTTLVQDSPSV